MLFLEDYQSIMPRLHSKCALEGSKHNVVFFGYTVAPGIVLNQEGNPTTPL